MVLRWPWVARTRVDGRLGRRTARVQAAVPPRRLPTRELVQRQGAGRLAGEHENEQVLTNPPAGASWAGCRRGAPTMGLDREVVTTLRGRWAGDGPVSSVPESPSGSVGNSLRPRHGRGT
jgi:hypothetical protein